jgi:hypothetical protein
MKSCPSTGLRQVKQVSSLTSKRRGCGAEERAKNKETRIGGWGGDPGLGECGWGDPHFSHFTGSTRHSSVGNRTGCHQGVRRGRATCYLIHAVFGRSGLAGPLAAGLGESDDDGERGCRKSDVAGGQGGHLVDPRRGRARMRSSIEIPCFWMMSWNVSGLFRWGDTSASWRLRAKDLLKQCFRACTGVGACVTVC